MIACAAKGKLVAAKGYGGQHITTLLVGDRTHHRLRPRHNDGDAGEGFLGSFVGDDATDDLGVLGGCGEGGQEDSRQQEGSGQQEGPFFHS